MISGKRILLGVTGSIAAYKSAELARRLRDAGAEVRVAMTASASRFVSPLTFEILSGRPVLLDEFSASASSTVGHIAITDNLDLALIAPATANIIGKMAAGIADDGLTTALLAAECPLLIAPAMNDRMYRNPVVQRNIATLRELGVRFVDPETGPLACGTTGQGRLADIDRILQEAEAMTATREMDGVTVLVTAGPTREPIDPVRFISNPSTGKMGFAIAAAARDRGANVVLVAGPTDLAPPHRVHLIRVTTAADMKRAALAHAARSQVIIMTAAVSDFRPADVADRKIKKEHTPASIAVQPTDDILVALGALEGRRLLVGFAAETDDIIANAQKKRTRKNLDLIVVNNVLEPNAGFGSDTNRAALIGRDGEVTELPLMPKRQLAEIILDKITQLSAKQGLLP